MEAAVKKSIITIAGSIGSGKSSTAKSVASALGFQHFSSGDLMRQIAAERNLSVEEINALSVEERHEVDQKVDRMLRDLGNGNNVVIDSRLAFHWIPDSFKLFLYVDPETAAERIFSQILGEGRVSQNGSSVEEISAATKTRTEQEISRYNALYGVDIYDMTQFDAMFHTGKNDLPTVTAMALAAFHAWQEN